tara:strand:- start:1373 stop:1627 length:255 start_codon:yes stop_codon:yes gene_type:complete
MKAQSKTIRFYGIEPVENENIFLAELTIAKCEPCNLVYYIQPLQKIFLNQYQKVLIEISDQKPLQIVREEMETKMKEFIKKATL